MWINYTVSGMNSEGEIEIPDGFSLQSLLTQKGESRENVTVTVNGRPITNINSYTLNDGDSIFITRTTKQG